MSNRRAARVASAVQEEVGRALLTEVKDPRVGPLSITEVIVNDDLSVALIRYLPLGGQGDRTSIAAGLAAVAKQLRGPVGRALGLRHAPELRFEIDKNIEYAQHMDEVFSRLPKPSDEPSGEES
jgi:ribosome-binding factor A